MYAMLMQGPCDNTLCAVFTLCLQRANFALVIALHQQSETTNSLLPMLYLLISHIQQLLLCLPLEKRDAF